MSYEVEEWPDAWLVTGPHKSDPSWFRTAVARCPTREAAEAACRLLSGECERELAAAQIDRMVAAKTGEGKPMRYAYSGAYIEGHDKGLADGAAQERARIVAILRAAHPWRFADV